MLDAARAPIEPGSMPLVETGSWRYVRAAHVTEPSVHPSNAAAMMARGDEQRRFRRAAHRQYDEADRVPSGTHAVTSAALCLVQLLVGALDQIGRRFVVLQERATNADRDRDLLALEAEAVASDARA